MHFKNRLMISDPNIDSEYTSDEISMMSPVNSLNLIISQLCCNM